MDKLHYCLQCINGFFVSDGAESAEDILRTRFTQMNLEIDAFSSIKYVGLQTVNGATDYEQLQSAIKAELNNTTVRSARKPHLVYNTFKTLNVKFSSNTESFSNTLFPDQYFTCPVKCLSCGNRCSNNMGHLRQGKPHNINIRLVLSDTSLPSYCIQLLQVMILPNYYINTILI